jgi:hypothetical protein
MKNGLQAFSAQAMRFFLCFERSRLREAANLRIPKNGRSGRFVFS